jgi:hypothetical protein
VQISRRIRAKSHFLPGKKFSAAAVYHPRIKHRAPPWNPAPCLRYLHLSPSPFPALSACRLSRADRPELETEVLPRPGYTASWARLP